MSDVLTELNHLDIHFKLSNIVLWSDSSIVIAWMNSYQLLKPYVANRVAQILDQTHRTQWRYVPTESNPADLISREIPVETLQMNSLWWKGPSWLMKNPNCWPTCSTPICTVPETRTVKLVLTAIQDITNSLLKTQSRWIPLIRSTAWILRFVNNLRSKLKSGSKQLCSSGFLTVKEFQNARVVLFQVAQRAAFYREFQDLKQDKQVFKKSSLKTLNPFIDSDQLIRVGGRLTKSSLSYANKCPIVIPSNHKITKLLFKYEHERLLHIGPQALLAHIHRSCWPIRGRNLAKTTVHNCITCFKFSPSLQKPCMAALPKERVTIDRPFHRSGVGFCGPILVRSGIRRVTAIKCYVAVFICFVTRAVHLELVSNLTSDAFLAALTRFMARRGMCAYIHSNNATNFVGANQVLRNYFKLSSNNKTVSETLANEGIQWHFNTPDALHFGGLWEAAVKSAKSHLIKVTKGALFSFEEINTLLCHIEAVLNSRPMTAISTDPNDYHALTSSHFLIGGSVIMSQEPDLSTVPTTRLRHFKLMRAQLQHFWKRWSQEYLPQLQKRGKWTTLNKQVQIGDLAVLKVDNVAIMKWNHLVRVVDIHPGDDGVVRVVSIQTPDGAVMKRPVTKIALLPMNQDEDGSIIGDPPQAIRT